MGRHDELKISTHAQKHLSRRGVLSNDKALPLWGIEQKSLRKSVNFIDRLTKIVAKGEEVFTTSRRLTVRVNAWMRGEN